MVPVNVNKPRYLLSLYLSVRPESVLEDSTLSDSAGEGGGTLGRRKGFEKNIMPMQAMKRPMLEMRQPIQAYNAGLFVRSEDVAGTHMHTYTNECISYMQ